MQPAIQTIEGGMMLRGMIAVVATAGFSGIALAQAPVSVPGSADAARVVDGNREQNAGYNRVVGKLQQGQADEKQVSGIVGKAVPVQAGDVVAGKPLRDVEGQPIGQVASVDADSAVVATGASQVDVPLEAFGKDDAGLLLSVTAAQFQELVAQATAQR